MPDCPTCGQTMPAAPTDIAAVVMATAAAEWARDVREPPHPGGAARIDSYIRGTLGLGWGSVEVGPGARPGIPYTRNRQFEWCGAFAAYCYGVAGLKRIHRLKRMASTYRLWAWAREDGGARWVDPADLRPGDIVVMGPEGDRDGAHIGIFLEWTSDPFPVVKRVALTVEGNASGIVPGGRTVEGVVHQSRPLASANPAEYRIIFGVRPLASDFDEVAR